ncbi:biotin-dependent carboxyltransferase family protein [Affinibrenneria salicis]|uniref:Biotin-dependent carboxyltransferase family protein n=1 Tax=Affinibrenneria salicis TaxID=2590031 RepID=A0A5J5FRK2_9GAMM|nr:biotin-dependent carboxyltransferase family protein [Affinibrenneria salicis]KAA8995772.1 biotin-dependent carboxyltransferase family protein [Affinibrenneria salicis]
MGIQVIKPGLCTTIHDQGRYGYQHLGVPVSGPMDEVSHTLANLLVGNPRDCSTLEVTLLGPELLFQSRCLMAIAGADLSATLDGAAIKPGVAMRVEAGGILRFGQRISGARAYIAVHGGYLIPPVLGSRSTYCHGRFGGIAGRPLQAGDQIAIPSSFRNVLPRLPPPQSLMVDRFPAAPIRVIAGREWRYFSEEARQALTENDYQISSESERMGYRLIGDALSLREPLELLSEAVTFGTIQVPPSGQPILLMADRQTTGGYPKIAHVISVDLPLLAQRLPGETIHFALCDLHQAQMLRIERARLIDSLEEYYV